VNKGKDNGRVRLDSLHHQPYQSTRPTQYKLARTSPSAPPPPPTAPRSPPPAATEGTPRRPPLPLLVLLLLRCWLPQVHNPPLRRGLSVSTHCRRIVDDVDELSRMEGLQREANFREPRRREVPRALLLSSSVAVTSARGYRCTGCWFPKVLPCEQPLEAQLSGVSAHDGAES
jgi:hypothetical protein